MYYKLNRDAVRALRNAKGLTQKGLAQKLFVGASTVACWESQSSSIHEDELKKMAQFFGVAKDYLIEQNSDIKDKKKLAAALEEAADLIQSCEEDKPSELDIRQALMDIDTVRWNGRKLSDEDVKKIVSIIDISVGGVAS